MASQQVEPGGWLAVKGRTTLGFHPIRLKLAVPIIKLALLDEQIIAVQNGLHLAGQAQSGLRYPNGLKFPITPLQRLHLA